jgi:hypothetical protein
VYRTPGFVPGQQLLTAWEPPREEKKVPSGTKTVAETKAPTEKKATRPAEQDEAAAQLAQLRTSHEEGNMPALLAAARLFLTGDRARSFKMLEIAREYLSRGDKNTAIALTTEVLRRTPGFPPALRLLHEIEGSEKK